ncbi:hypothetical protein EYC84_004385 [Monilinia fructicola]|uniref:Uncharacterized protein n=1 Tax=Monilinia fructicola TaxID=38448 RepID=A0A5M9K062_MONFR|nr:hypothetical protein EYC84_004385 [Monilinia fructicola]
MVYIKQYNFRQIDIKRVAVNKSKERRRRRRRRRRKEDGTNSTQTKPNKLQISSRKERDRRGFFIGSSAFNV